MPLLCPLQVTSPVFRREISTLSLNSILPNSKAIAYETEPGQNRVPRNFADCSPLPSLYLSRYQGSSNDICVRLAVRYYVIPPYYSFVSHSNLLVSPGTIIRSLATWNPYSLWRPILPRRLCWILSPSLRSSLSSLLSCDRRSSTIPCLRFRRDSGC